MASLWLALLYDCSRRAYRDTGTSQGVPWWNSICHRPEREVHSELRREYRVEPSSLIETRNVVCTRSGASRTATKSDRVRERPDCAGTSSTTSALSHTRPELPNSTNSSAINDASRSGLARTSGSRQLRSSSKISSCGFGAEDIAYAV